MSAAADGIAADPPTAVVPAADTPPAAAAHSLDLTRCLELAHRAHPRVVAQRLSLAAAEDGVRGLDAIGRAANLLTPELPVRRKQAALGLTAAAAALDEAERETAYAVTRAYFTVLYAREQERLALRVVLRLTVVREAAQRLLDAGVRDVSSASVSRTAASVRLADLHRIEAGQGVKRALAALREACGLPPGAAVEVPDVRLAAPAARPDKEAVVAAATCRRGSVVRAAVFADVAGLEVAAQAASLQKRLDTFATGSDVHAASVPGAVRGEAYRPGGIRPEMPDSLAGPRAERVKHADTLHRRAAVAADGTRSLIALEAEDAFFQWEQASLQAAVARAAADEAEVTAEDLIRDFTSGAKLRVEDVVSARVVASQSQGQANEFVYRQIIALADLERITAGGFCAGLTAAVAPPPSEAKKP